MAKPSPGRSGTSSTGPPKLPKEKSQRRTTDPRTILIALAVQALVPRADDGRRLPDQFLQIRGTILAHVAAPRRIVGAVQDELGEFDIYFNDGQHEYRYEGLSSGEKMVLLLLIRFVAEHMHRSLVLIDELATQRAPLVAAAPPPHDPADGGRQPDHRHDPLPLPTRRGAAGLGL